MCRDLDDPARKWGVRIAVVGSPGKGKTFFSQRFADYLAARVDLVMIHDQKDPDPQYRGAVRGDFAAVVAHPPEQGNVLVFHRAYPPPEHPEAIAARSLLLARNMRVRNAVIIDEIFYAQSGRQCWRDGPDGPIAELIRMGRSSGASFIAGTQIPQSLPTELLDLAGSLVLFGLDSRGARYMQRSEDLDPEVVAVLRRLKEGEFITLVRGEDWNRTIYGPA